MKKLKYFHAKSLICFLITSCFVLLAFSGLLGLKKFSNLYYINDDENNSLSALEGYMYQEKNATNDVNAEYSILFYKNEGTQEIQAPQIGNSCITKVIITCGRSDLFITDALRIDYDENALCIIGARDAYDLFGTKNVRGRKIQYCGKEYTVVDVTKDMNHIFLAQTQKDSEIHFNRAIISNENENEALLIKNSVENSFNLGICMENMFVEWCMGLLVVVAPISLILYAGWYFRKKSRSNIAKAVVPLLTVVLIVSIVIVVIDYPEDMIPLSWSDFEFWGELFENKIKSIQTFLYCEKTEVEIMYMSIVLKTFICGLISIFTCIIAFLMFQYEEEKHKWQTLDWRI